MIRLPAFIAMFAATAFQTAGAQQISEDCLFDRPANIPSRDCRPDPYGMANETAVAAALEGLGLSPAQISFYGCAEGAFGTSVVQGGTRPYLYRINYPLSEGYRSGAYAGAITHELAHANQLEDFGNIAALRARFGPDRLELGADFVTGFLFRRRLNLGRSEFLHGVALLGDYRSGGAATHSSPEGRSIAFRMGYFYQPEGANLREAIAEFQNNRYPAIQHDLLR